MEHNPLISIIIPVYNNKQYLGSCFNSISSQTYTNFEVIIIDDGSIDGSGEICDKYAEMDSRFKVLHKQNGGVSSARNIGLQQSNGEWVTFCDSDDELFNNSLSTLISCIEQGVDSVCAGYVKMDESQMIIEKTGSFNKTKLNRLQALTDFYEPILGESFNGYIVNRLFKNKIIQEHNLKFREDIFIKEDGLFLVDYLSVCNDSHIYVSNPIYKYIIHTGSAMTFHNKKLNKKSISNLYARIECYKRLKGITKDKHLLSLSKNSICQEYIILTSRFFKGNLNKFVSFIKFSYHTFKYITPINILYYYFIIRDRKKIKGLRIKFPTNDNESSFFSKG